MSTLLPFCDPFCLIVPIAVVFQWFSFSCEDSVVGVSQADQSSYFFLGWGHRVLLFTFWKSFSFHFFSGIIVRAYAKGKERNFDLFVWFQYCS